MKNKTKILGFISLLIIMVSFFGITILLNKRNLLFYEIFFNPFMIIGLILWLFISIFVHEFGHFFFGLITGFHFLSFQVFTLLIKKRKQKGIMIKRITFNGLAGQCLMSPPKDKKPFILYNLGGVIFNILTFFALFLILFFDKPNIYWQSIFYSGAFINYFLFFMNAIPLKGFLNNDGLNMLNYFTNPSLIENIYQNLAIVAQLTNDTLYENLNIPELAVHDDYKNNFFVFTEIMTFMKLQSQDKDDESIIKMESLYRNRYSIIENYRNLIVMMYYTSLILNNRIDDAKVVFERLDKKIKKVLPQLKADWGLFAHLLSLIIDGKNEKAFKIIEKALLKTSRTSYYADEVRMNKMLIKIKEMGETYDYTSIQVTTPERITSVSED